MRISTMALNLAIAIQYFFDLLIILLEGLKSTELTVNLQSLGISAPDVEIPSISVRLVANQLV
jgi:hypothetical protein